MFYTEIENEEFSKENENVEIVDDAENVENMDWQEVVKKKRKYGEEKHTEVKRKRREEERKKHTGDHNNPKFDKKKQKSDIFWMMIKLPVRIKISHKILKGKLNGQKKTERIIKLGIIRSKTMKRKKV